MIVIAACRARTRRLMRPSGLSSVGAVYDGPQCRIETSRAVILLRLRAVALALRGPPLQFRPYAGARSGSTGPALSVSDPPRSLRSRLLLTEGINILDESYGGVKQF